MTKQHLRIPIEGGKVRNIILDRPREEWTEIGEGVVPQIISEEMFEEAQQILDASVKTANKNPDATFLNAGNFVYCGYCNRACSIHNVKRAGGKVVPEYRCTNAVVRGDCQGVTLKAEPVETAVWERVQRVINDPVELEEVLCKKWHQLEQTAERDLAPIDAAIEEAEKEIINLAMGIASAKNPTSINALVSLSDRAAESKQSLEAERLAVLRAHEVIAREREDLNKFRQWCANNAGKLPTNKEKKDACDRLGVRVRIYRRGYGKTPMTIEIDFSPSAICSMPL